MSPPIALLFLSALVGGVAAYFCYQPRWQYNLSHSQTLVLYSLNPNARGHPGPGPGPGPGPSLVVDKALICAPTDKRYLLEAINQAPSVHGSYGEASCFNPRHAVSTLDGRTSITLCFECSSAEIRTKDQGAVVPTNEQAQSLFDRLTRKYHLKTDK